jgi:SPP1 family predicted phage head-tail adaptor
MIKAGVMRERITIESPEEARNTLGEATLSWATYAIVWASVDGLSSREMLQAQQANAVASHKVRIRFLQGLSHTHRLVWRGRVMEIASVVERENRTMHEILAREVQ